MASVVMLSCFPWMFARVLASFTSVAKRLFPVDGHPHIPSPTQPLTPLPTSSLALRKVQAPRATHAATVAHLVECAWAALGLRWSRPYRSGPRVGLGPTPPFDRPRPPPDCALSGW